MNTKKHSLSLDSRASLNITAVDDVVSFDESSVVLKTVCGELVVEGDD